MTEARVGYHKEVKTASFQGKSITVENLTPMLSPRARDKRKREIESCLYEVFEVCAGTGADALMRDILEMRGCQRYNIGVRFGSSYTERSTK